MTDNKSMTEALRGFRMPSYEQIPDVGLYLDQVSKFINSFLIDFPEMNVTPSMISNYAKQKLIDRVNKKTYTRVQIAALIMIVLSKTVISIEHVRMMLEELRDQDDTLKDAYTQFAECLCEVLQALSENEMYHPGEALDDTAKMMRNTVIAIAHKMYLERYFESRAAESKEN